jgi:hypothetical protein
MVGCTLSHLALLKHIIAAEIPETLIFENDVELPADFHERFKTFYSNLPADWDMAYLGWSFGDPTHDEQLKRPVAPGVALIPTGSMQTHAYMVTLRAAKFLDAHCQQVWRPIDVSYMKEGENYLRMYFADPRFAFQLTADHKLDGSLHFDAGRFAAVEKPAGGVGVISNGDSWRYE